MNIRRKVSQIFIFSFLIGTFAKKRAITCFGIWLSIFIFNRLELWEKLDSRKYRILFRQVLNLRKSNRLFLSLLTNICSFFIWNETFYRIHLRKNHSNRTNSLRNCKDFCRMKKWGKRKTLSVRLSESNPLE